ncbi:TetR family transcriptional regulator [Neisseriaceae bacterium B1]
MRKTKAEAEQTRQDLLTAALDTFFENGVTNTSLQAIAEQAGVTRGALYWHFKNKEDLFDALFQKHFAPFTQQMERIFTLKGNAWDNLRQILHDILIMLENEECQRKFCCVMHAKCEQTSKNASITELERLYHQRSYLQLHRVLQYCQQQGSLPEKINIDLASIYLKSSFTGIINIWVYAPEVLPLSTTGALLLNASLDNLENNATFYNPNIQITLPKVE